MERPLTGFLQTAQSTGILLQFLQYGGVPLLYSEMLHVWGYLEQRIILRKRVQKLLSYLGCAEYLAPNYKEESLVFGVICGCEKMINDFEYRIGTPPSCKFCNKIPVNCVVCRKPVKGLSMFCSNCGHGGHAFHIQNWFSQSKEITCPIVGCNCKCCFVDLEHPKKEAKTKSNTKPVEIKN